MDSLLSLFLKLNNLCFLVEKERVQAAAFSTSTSSDSKHAQWQAVLSRTATYQSMLEHLHDVLVRSPIQDGAFLGRFSLVLNNLYSALDFEEHCFHPSSPVDQQQQRAWLEAWPRYVHRVGRDRYSLLLLSP
jgi:hypothetical protein